jgi:hypothetical protein
MEAHKSLSDRQLLEHAINTTGGRDRLAELIGGIEGPTVNGWRFKGLPHGMRSNIERILKYEIHCDCMEELGKAKHRVPRTGT